MKVVHVYRTYFPDTQGGLEEMIRQLCREIEGVENRVFTLSPDPLPREQLIDGVRVYRAKRHFEVASNSISLSCFAEFRRQLEWADLVHYHFPWPYADVLHLLCGQGKPSILTYHSDIVRQQRLLTLYKPLMNHFLGGQQRIVATSPNYVETSPVLQEFRDRVSVIPIGIDKPRFCEPSQALRETMAVKYGRDFFLFVGVLRYYKGLHFLIEAARDSDLPVVIAGAGPSEAELRQQVADAGMRNVVFTGFVSNEEKWALYQLCRAVVFPSHLRSEAFGVTLLEGAMNGCPLITTNVGTGTSFVNIDGETGFVVPPADTSALRKVMMNLAGDRALAQKMGAAAADRYRERFTAAKMAAAYRSLYTEVLESVH